MDPGARGPGAGLGCAVAVTEKAGEVGTGSTTERVVVPGGWTGGRAQIVWFVAFGVLSVAVGGLLAAVTAPAPTELGTWAVAYLVLVAGLAQVGLGMGQGMCTGRVSTVVVGTQVVGWNVGSAAVMVGTLSGVWAVADVGAAVLVVTLILLARGLTGPRQVGLPRWFRYGYGLLIAVLLLSIPVGLVLLRLRAR